MSNKKAQLEITGNATGIERTFDKVKQGGRDMAKSVTQSGQDAAKGLDGIGDGAEKGAGKVDKATGSIIASIQRANAVAEAGAKGTAKYYEALANVRGADMAAIKPHLDAMRAIEAAQGTVVLSAKQTAAAMRGVPAQFTDIVTSLQGGQAPLTVFLQQGGQLKDMFGGAGNAARALGGYVMGLVNPFTVAAAAAAVAGLAYYKGSQEADEFRKALVLSGNAAGASTAQLAGMAQAMGAGFGNTVGRAAEALALLAGTGQVGRASLQDFAATAIAAEKSLGIAAKDIAKNFADLGKDPAVASLKLNESLNYLTASTYQQIKAAQDLGQESKAAALAQDAYNNALKGRAAEVVVNLGYVEKAWGGVKNVAKETWDAMLGVGRDKDVSTELEKARTKLQDNLKKQKSYGADSMFAPILERDAATLRNQIESLGELERMQKRAGNATAERVALERSGVEAVTALTKANTSALTKQEQATKAIADYRREVEALRKVDPGSALITSAQIAKTEAAIRAQYKETEKAASVYDQLNKRIGDFAAMQSAAAQAQTPLTEGQRLAVRVAEDMAAAGKKLSATDKDRLQITLQAALVTEQRTLAEKDLAKFLEESNKQQAKAATEADKSIAALQKQAAAEREAMAGIGLSKEALAELTSAKYDDSAASKDRLANIMAEAGEPELLVKKYREEAQALRDLAAARRERGAAETGEDLRKAAAKAAEQAQKEGQRSADAIERALTDSLMRGFENGKGFGENMRDTIVNMFKTMVLRPVIQAAVTPISAALVGGLGFGTAAAAATGSAGSSALTTAGSAAGLAGLAGSASLFGSGISSGLSAWGAGGSVTGLLGSGSSLFAGGMANGLGVVAGALGPIVLGVMALKALMDMDDSGTMHTGGLGSYSARSGASVGDVVKGQGLSFNLSSNDYMRSTEQASVQLAQSVVGMLDSTAKSFGQQAGYWAATGFADDTSKDGAWGALAIKMGDTLLKDWKDGADKWPGREFANGEAGAKEYALAVAQDVRDVLLTQTPDWADTMLNALGDAPSIEALATTVAQINGIQDAFVRMGQTLPQLAGLSDSAVQGLLTAFGGVDNLSNALGGYYQSFYSEAERTAQAATNVANALTQIGAGTPTTIAGFRQLVEAQDLTTEAGRSTYASLIALSPAFAEVTNAADAAAKAIADAAKAVSDQRATLQQQLDQAMGNTAAIRARELAALDPSNRALQQRIYLLADEEAAMQASVRNTDAALAAVRKAVDAEKTLHQVRVSAAQEQVSTTKGIFDTLDSAIASLLGGAATSAQAGEDFIAQALTAARTTGYLPDQKDLFSAITAATGGLASRVYTSAAEQQADRLRLAAKLGDLKTVAGDQLSTAEQTLKNSQDQLTSLESIYTQAQKQVDVLRGIDTTAKTIPDALTMLGATLTAELRAVASAAAAGSASARASVVPPISSLTSTAQAASAGYIQSPINEFGSRTGVGDSGYRLEKNASGATLYFPGGGSHAVSGGDAATLLTSTYGLVSGGLSNTLIRTRAMGGYTPPGLTWVGEEGPELVNFDRPGQVYTAAQSANLMGGNTQRLESLVEGLTQQVVYLREQNDALVRDARRTADATNGNPERPVLVEIAT